MQNPICERCENTVKEVFMCERCESLICDNCAAVYNQFTQIDYNCCKTCASILPDDYKDYDND